MIDHVVLGVSDLPTSRALRTTSVVLTIVTMLLLATACARVGTGAGLAGCPESGLEMSVEPPDQHGSTGYLTIVLSNCADEPRLLDSHPEVGIVGAAVEAPRAGNRPASLSVLPGMTLVATMSWGRAADDTVRAATVDQLRVSAPPNPAEQVIALDSAVELDLDRFPGVGPWQLSEDDRGAPAGTGSPEPGEPECPEEGFRITVTGSNAALGLRASMIEMLNCGDAAIEVNGYPVVQVLHHGRPVHVDVRQGSTQLHDPGPTSIALAPGGTVSAGMLWRNKVEWSQDVEVVNATELVVSYALGAASQVVVPEYSVDLGTSRWLELTAWR